MNNKIIEAAQAHAAQFPEHFRSGTIGDFTAGAEYFQKESGADEMAEALEKLLARNKISEITDTEDWHRGRRGDDFKSDELSRLFYMIETNLAKYLSFTKKEENGCGKESI